jgi:hypothetical protein
MTANRFPIQSFLFCIKAIEKRVKRLEIVEKEVVEVDYLAVKQLTCESLAG